MAAQEGTSRRWRPWLVSLAITAGLFAYLLSEIDLAELARTARELRRGYLAWFVVVLLLGVGFRAVRFWVLLDRTVRLRTLVAITLAPAAAQNAATEDLTSKSAPITTEKVVPLMGEQAMAAEEPNFLTEWLKEAADSVEIHGFVDTGYTLNLSRPRNGRNGNTGDTNVFDPATGAPTAGAPALNGDSIRAFDNQCERRVDSAVS